MKSLLLKNLPLVGIFILSSSMLYAEEENQLYVGIGAGTADYQKGPFNDDDNLKTFSIGYDYSDFYSVEVSYLDLGTVSDRYFPNNVITVTPDTLMLDVKGLTIAPAFEFDLSPHWSVSARLGLAVLEFDKTWFGGTVIDDTYLYDDGVTETDFFYGFRLQYDMNDHTTFELNWDKYEVDSIDVDTVYAKLNFYF